MSDGWRHRKRVRRGEIEVEPHVGGCVLVGVTVY